jgi:hypothetical protein
VDQIPVLYWMVDYLTELPERERSGVNGRNGLGYRDDPMRVFRAPPLAAAGSRATHLQKRELCANAIEPTATPVVERFGRTEWATLVLTQVHSPCQIVFRRGERSSGGHRSGIH